MQQSSDQTSSPGEWMFLGRRVFPDPDQPGRMIGALPFEGDDGEVEAMDFTIPADKCEWRAADDDGAEAPDDRGSRRDKRSKGRRR